MGETKGRAEQLPQRCPDGAAGAGRVGAECVGRERNQRRGESHRQFVRFLRVDLDGACGYRIDQVITYRIDVGGVRFVADGTQFRGYARAPAREQKQKQTICSHPRKDIVDKGEHTFRW